MLLVSRLVFILIWSGPAIGLLLGIEDRFIVSLLIICSYMFVSHTLMTVMFRDLWWTQKRWNNLALIMLCGPVEVNRLRRQARKSQQPLASTSDQAPGL